jgi:hypothetical protein
MFLVQKKYYKYLNYLDFLKIYLFFFGLPFFSPFERSMKSIRIEIIPGASKMTVDFL